MSHKTKGLDKVRYTPRHEETRHTRNKGSGLNHPIQLQINEGTGGLDGQGLNHGGNTNAVKGELQKVDLVHVSVQRTSTNPKGSVGPMNQWFFRQNELTYRGGNEFRELVVGPVVHPDHTQLSSAWAGHDDGDARAAG